ncbi:MAG: NAD(P)-dependent oxidoreductase [Propionicimonas sp.]|nr:NAD(P)-dependent oxidoreductase [Propionicimonas sp.]
MASPYLVGLRLHGRGVVVVGGGRVAARRVPKLLAAGAVVSVVSPAVLPGLEALAADGGIDWVPRDYRPGDLAGAWYVIAATSSSTVNAAVANEADERHTFCVRADDADHGTAWTPATGEHDGLVVGVVGRHDPRRSRAARDRLVEVLEDEEL